MPQKTPPRILLLPVTLLLGCASGPAIPSQALHHNAAGAGLLGRGDLDAAEARFRLALEYHSGFPEAHANLGLVALRRGDLVEAEHHLRDALVLDEDFALALADLGVVLEARGDCKGAALAYERALGIDPGLVTARRNLSLLLAASSRFELARAHLMRLLAIEPGNQAMAALLAYCELRLGRPRAAERRAGEVLGERPDEPAARLVRGILEARRGAYGAALRDLSVAEGHPALGHAARVRKAAVLLALGDRERASSLCARLLRERPEDPAVRLLGAWLALAQGQARLAHLHAEAVLARRPEHVAAARVRAAACARGAPCDP